ncbi:MAG: response regulator [Desulfuromonadaceae bacterium]
MIIFRNLKIRNKLILGFLTVVVLTLAVDVISYFQINKIMVTSTMLFERGVVALEQIGIVSSNFQRVRSNVREIILENSQEEISNREKRIWLYRDQADKAAATLEKVLPDHEAEILFTYFKEASKLYGYDLIRTIEMAKKNHDAEAMLFIHQDAYKAEREMIEYIGLLTGYLSSTAKQLSDQNIKTATTSGRVILFLTVGSTLLAALMALIITRSIATPLKRILAAMLAQQRAVREKSYLVEAIAAGDLSREVVVGTPLTLDGDQVASDETGILLKAIVEMSEMQHLQDRAFVKMTDALRSSHDQEALRNWFREGRLKLAAILQGDKSTAEFTDQALAFLVTYLRAGIGVFYLFDETEGVLTSAATYAVADQAVPVRQLRLGEGVTGQAALDQKMICLNSVPPDYLSISSGLGSSRPAHIIILPLVHDYALTGLLEIASFSPFSQDDQEFLHRIMDTLAAAITVTKARQKINELLEQTQGQTEELRVQHEELQQTNEELEERSRMLEHQREEIRSKNREVVETAMELQRKADELERVSTYKSEFLANMSHELRTPLNSLLILSSLLKDNREGNLTTRQVEFAATINGAGHDLLLLINDILDLSKIESGYMKFYYEELVLPEMCLQLQAVFNPIAIDKGIELTVSLDGSVPKSITTDIRRTEQILKNLLSNACKFTSQGSVSLHMYTPELSENPLHTDAVAFVVTDTGIGIPADKHALVFNAFQQADGSTSRNYGGTGLGLSISRQLARSMGGEISLASEAGAGSSFTLYLPVTGVCDFNPEAGKSGFQTSQTSQTSQTGLKATSVPPKSAPPAALLPEPIPDDRTQLREDGRSILIIEDDITFAGILLKMVRDRGFSALIATDGESGIAMAERYQPGAILLDVMLPHIDGWDVMRNLKGSRLTRHIPVHFVTCLNESQKAMSMGAVGFVTKPVSSEQMDSVFGTLEAAIGNSVKKLLIVEDNPHQAAALVALLGERPLTITLADSGTKAVEFLSGEQYDCIVLDLGLADMGAFELLDELKKFDPERRIPVIIHTGRELTHEDEKRLHHYAGSIIIKGAKSHERLLNEVTLFLHLVETSLDPDKQHMIRSTLDRETQLAGKKILIVDDDMRNIFSLSSVLSEKEIVIFEAENGCEALKQLDQFPDIDLVLMDIMMPEMDGYEAMRAIRKDSRFKALPIIALTAKAMKGDREECLKAGASDYIPKPVDVEKLFSLLRVWLYSREESV